MKKSDIQKLLLESVKEVVREDNINLDEIDFGSIFKSTPPSDEDIEAYLKSRPRDKVLLDKDPEKKAAWIKFVRSNKTAGKAVKSKEVVFAVWDPEKKEYSEKKSVGMNSPTSFGEGKEEIEKNQLIIKKRIEDNYKNKEEEYILSKKDISERKQIQCLRDGFKAGWEASSLNTFLKQQRN